jgi:hypothetical protein
MAIQAVDKGAGMTTGEVQHHFNHIQAMKPEEKS